MERTVRTYRRFDTVAQTNIPYDMLVPVTEISVEQPASTASSTMVAVRPMTRGRRKFPPSNMARTWSRAAVIATAISGLLATAMVANLFVIQSYERVLSRYIYDSMGTSRSLRRSSPNGNDFLLEMATSDIEKRYNCSPPTPHKPEPDGLKIAWLMSFPNSGTSFTSRLVRDATKTDSASNYADETPSGQNGLRLPVYDDQPEGPFWIKPEASPEFTEPTEYVISKVSDVTALPKILC
jgi:hypothetical protein